MLALVTVSHRLANHPREGKNGVLLSAPGVHLLPRPTSGRRVAVEHRGTMKCSCLEGKKRVERSSLQLGPVFAVVVDAQGVNNHTPQETKVCERYQPTHC